MKVFVTGVSGYIGGSIATRLVLGGHTVVGLIRNKERVTALEERGVQPVIGDLDSSDLIAEMATSCDAVINAANSDHLGAVEAIIRGLTGSSKAFIHTSGSSIVCDDALGEHGSDNVFLDDTAFTPVEHRVARTNVDRTVRRAAIESGIRAMVICPTMIYGRGLGLMPDSDQIPKIMRKSRERQAGVYIGRGVNIWSNVFINDLVDLYLLAMLKGPGGAFFFAENGENTLKSVAQAVSVYLGFEGRTESWNIDDAIAEYGRWARAAIATNSRVRAKNARQLLGWFPSGPSLENAVRHGL